MHRRLSAALTLTLALAILCLLVAREARAQQGFQLERFEPTPAGSWFVGVNHPWYSSTRWFAGGLTLDYGHNSLLGGLYSPNGDFQKTVAVVEHRLLGHVDLAGSFLDRIQLHFTLPVVLLERGTPAFGVSPISGAALGDPRVGLMVRVWGQPESSPISVHLGASLWIPVGAQASHAGDGTVRGGPQVVLAGLLVKHLRWAFNLGVVGRAEASLGFGPKNRVGTELTAGAALAWADTVRRYTVGAELLFATYLTGGTPFTKGTSDLQLLVSGGYNLVKQVQLNLAVGPGLVSVLGTPDVRAVFRLAYAPIRTHKPPPPPDSDGDGVADDLDACPREAGDRTALPATTGCPDRDHDGVPDAQDLCPTEKPGEAPDPKQKGCPVKDADHDGVADAEDLCPGEAAGDKPDPKRPGCAVKDEDDDGIADGEDQCPGRAAGAKPDPKRPGCPILDEDNDGIPDAEDACPKEAGVADAGDPKANGCPKVAVTPGSSTELRAVQFETNKAVLLPESFPVLDHVAEQLKKSPSLKRVIIEGHADDRGTDAWNLRLSKHRAKAVLDYLVSKGVPAGPLEYKGYGKTRPLVPGTTEEARARNRRVEIRIPE